MKMSTWREAVLNGITRLTKSKESYFFSRQELIQYELDQIAQEADTHGETPTQTLSRVLQELRDDNLVEFSDNQGNYIFLAENVNIEREDFPETAIDAAIKAQKLTFGDIPTNETISLARQRLGQQRLRYLTLENYQHQCALCDISDDRLLVASHLARWADSPKGRGDLTNVVCLCRWHDPLVEYGLISFADDYQILKKPTRSQMLSMILDHTNEYRRPIEMPLAPKYLALHRKRTGFA
jgi:DNA-binding transcriptional regulator YhcF (GntR family)